MSRILSLISRNLTNMGTPFGDLKFSMNWFANFLSPPAFSRANCSNGIFWPVNLCWTTLTSSVVLRHHCSNILLPALFIIAGVPWNGQRLVWVRGFIRSISSAAVGTNILALSSEIHCPVRISPQSLKSSLVNPWSNRNWFQPNLPNWISPSRSRHRSIRLEP